MNKLRARHGIDRVNYDHGMAQRYARYIWHAYNDNGVKLSWSEALKRSYNDIMLGSENYKRFLGGIDRGSSSIVNDVDAGRIHEIIGYNMAGKPSKTAEELKQIAQDLNDSGIKVTIPSGMKNARTIASRIISEVANHNYERAKADHEWAIKMINAAGRNQTKLAEILQVGDDEKYWRHQRKDDGKDWYRRWSRILHPDNNPGVPGAQEAFNTLKSFRHIYDPFRDEEGHSTRGTYWEEKRAEAWARREAAKQEEAKREED